MKMRALKQLSDKIRADNEGKSRISWPESFKESVVKELGDFMDCIFSLSLNGIGTSPFSHDNRK